MGKRVLCLEKAKEWEGPGTTTPGVHRAAAAILRVAGRRRRPRGMGWGGGAAGGSGAEQRRKTSIWGEKVLK